MTVTEEFLLALVIGGFVLGYAIGTVVEWLVHK